MFTRRAGMARFAYIRDKVMSLMDAGVLELIEGEQSITDHLTALPTPGHTPGHTSVLVTSAGESAVILGDAAHIPDPSASHRLESEARHESQTFKAAPRPTV